MVLFFFFKQKTAYEIVDCDWSSDVCSSDLVCGRNPSRYRLRHGAVFSLECGGATGFLWTNGDAAGAAKSRLSPGAKVSQYGFFDSFAQPASLHRNFGAGNSAIAAV